MNKLELLSYTAGLCFGLWPLFMNHSGLKGLVSASVFSASVALFILPFALGKGYSFAGARWFFIAGAGIFGGLGVIAFNTMLSSAKEQEVGKMFVLMILVQITLPIMYQLYQTGEYSPKRVLGVGAAVVAILLLR